MNEKLAQIYGTDKVAAAAQESAQISQSNFMKVAAAGGYDVEKEDETKTGQLYGYWQQYEKLAAEQGHDLSVYSAPQVAEAFNKWLQNLGTDKQAAEQAQQARLQQAESFIAKLAGEATTEEQIIKLATFLGNATAHAQYAAFNKLASGDVANDNISEEVAGSNARAHGSGSQNVSAGAAATSPAQHGHIRGPRAEGDPNNVPPASPYGTASTSRGDFDKMDFKGSKEPKPTEKDLTYRAHLAKEKAINKAKELWAHPNRNKALGIAGGVAAAGAAAYGAKKLYDRHQQDHDKAAFDHTAAQLAYGLLLDYGVDEKTASARLNDALVRGVGPTVSDAVKIAAAEDGNLAVQTRAVELLELAGYSFEDLEKHAPPRINPEQHGQLGYPGQDQASFGNAQAAGVECISISRGRQLLSGREQPSACSGDPARSYRRGCSQDRFSQDSPHEHSADDPASADGEHSDGEDRRSVRRRPQDEGEGRQEGQGEEGRQGRGEEGVRPRTPASRPQPQGGS